MGPISISQIFLKADNKKSSSFSREMYQAAAQVPNVPVQFFVSKEILKG